MTSLSPFLCTLFFLSSSALAAKSKDTASQERFRFRPGKGIQFTSADNMFSLSLRLRVQLFYTLDETNKVWQHSFNVRRARIKFVGHFFGKANEFKLALGVSPKDLDVEDGIPRQTPLRDWYVDLKHLSWLHVRVGQFKVGYSLSRMTSSKRFLFVDRSLVNKEFELDRDMGVALSFPHLFSVPTLQLLLTAVMGEGMGVDALSNEGLLYVVRLQYQPLGKLKSHSEDSLRRPPTPKLHIGFSYAFAHKAKRIQGNHGTSLPNNVQSDIHFMTADLVMKWSGFSFVFQWMTRSGEYTAVHPDEQTTQALKTLLPRNGWGMFGHIGYLLPSLPLSFGLRFGHIHPSDNKTSLTALNEFGGVFNVYFTKTHSYKLQLDYFYLFASLTNGDHQMRIQLQTTF